MQKTGEVTFSSPLPHRDRQWPGGFHAEIILRQMQ